MTLKDLLPLDQAPTLTLDDEQREAVAHAGGPLLIVAGAGTGKTTVIARRIAHLVESGAARPSEILALTFNEKAATEMQERVDELVPYGYADVTIATFHSFGEEILSAHGMEIGIAPGFTVLDKTAQALFLAERIEDLPLRRFAPLSDPTKYIAELAGYFSRAKDEPLTPDEIRARAEAVTGSAPDDPAALAELESQRELADVYERYNALLWRAGFVDFGDLLALTLRLLNERPETLKRFQERYRHVLVDEFQDTNPVQFKIVQRIAASHRNLVVVGDDDQSIYRFRGAHLRNILDFREHYPDAREIVLRRNHRSTKEILQAARRLIVANKERLEVRYGITKQLETEKTGPAPALREFASESEEAAWVAEEIGRAIDEGRRRYRDFAILVRNNRHAEPFMRALDERGLPFYFSGSRGLFQRTEVKELIALLHSLFQETRAEHLYLLAADGYGVPDADLTRLLHAEAESPLPFRAVLERAARGRAPVTVSEAGRERLAALIDDLEHLASFSRGRRTGEVLYRYLERRGILSALGAPASFEDEVRVRNIVKFFSIVRSFERVAVSDRVGLFLRHLAAIQEYGEDPAVAEIDSTSDVIQVLTVHKAKGLEFPVVFLVQMATNRFPVSYRSQSLALPVAGPAGGLDASESHREEERRLCYVALTRAKDELITTFARDYGGKRERNRSLFLSEAFDLGKPLPSRKRRRALDEIEQHRPGYGPSRDAPERIAPHEPLALSFRRLEDYETCPLKYRFLHQIGVEPILMIDHRVNFGSAVHRAVAFALEARRRGESLTRDGVIDVFRASWRSEGYRSEEHERRRFEQGVEALERFLEGEAAAGLVPAAVERHFRVKLGAIVVSGSIDRVDEGPGGVTLIDYKTSDFDDEDRADQRAKESLQLSVYALAYRELTGAIPDRLELRYVLTGTKGTSSCDEIRCEKTRATIERIAGSIRAGDFTARPDARRCAICACAPICAESAV